MSRETEKIFRQMSAYIEEHQDEISGEADRQKLVERFIEEYNNANIQEDAPEAPDVYDYLELAESASTKKKRLEYLSKALELEPDNLDAAFMVAEEEAKSPEDMLGRLSSLIEKGNAQMEEGGFFREAMGEFWGVLETRPYMRLLHARFEMLVLCGMMQRAAEEAKRMLRLCKGDNLGVRYALMHLYAYLEDEKAALALHKKFGGHEESQMLLPLAILYYKANDFEKSLSYLQRLNKANKDTKKFLNAVSKDDLDRYADKMSPYGYQPNTIEELVCEYNDNFYLFIGVRFFFDWAYNSLKNTKNQGKSASKRTP